MGYNKVSSGPVAVSGVPCHKKNKKKTLHRFRRFWLPYRRK